MPTRKAEATTLSKLSHLYHVAFAIPKLTQNAAVIRGNKAIRIRTPFQETCIVAGIIPFWEETCPEEYSEEWGQDWSTIRRRMKRLGELKGIKRVSAFDWHAGRLDRVLKWARKENVSGCFDSPVHFLHLCVCVDLGKTHPFLCLDLARNQGMRAEYSRNIHDHR